MDLFPPYFYPTFSFSSMVVRVSVGLVDYLIYQIFTRNLNSLKILIVKIRRFKNGARLCVAHHTQARTVAYGQNIIVTNVPGL